MFFLQQSIPLVERASIKMHAGESLPALLPERPVRKLIPGSRTVFGHHLSFGDERYATGARLSAPDWCRIDGARMRARAWNALIAHRHTREAPCFFGTARLFARFNLDQWISKKKRAIPAIHHDGKDLHQWKSKKVPVLLFNLVYRL